MSRTPALDAVVSMLVEAGWVEDGRTRIEHVRIPTRENPVFGGTGGECRALGGRRRFALGETERVTVGRFTTNFYDSRRGAAARLVGFSTADLDGIRAHLATLGDKCSS